MKRPNDFEEYCSSFKSYKESRRGYTRNEIVQTDVNNYMFIRQQNDSEKAMDFFSTHSYLISADHILCDWDRAERPGAVPIVVLPSVWYSLILQYVGRADDDFASFTRFLNFSLSSYEDEDPRKMEILKKVISLEEPKEIKERTIFDIEKKLSTDYKDFDSIDDIVDTSHEFILDQERARITAEVKGQADLEIENFKADTTAEFNRVLREKENEHLAEKARHAKEELEMTEKNRELLSKVDEARKKGAQEVAEKLADKALIPALIFYWVIAVLFIIGVLFAAFVCIMKTCNGQLQWLPTAYANAPAIVDGIIAILIAVVGFLVFKKLLCGLDKDAIRNRLIEKYSR